MKPCAFAGPLPGMAADVVDDSGKAIVNQVGELVIRRPWIGMSRGFWKDPERYLETYWSQIPGVWVHGDWARVDADGFWYILGRSDDTIKVAGKRIGPAEMIRSRAASPRREAAGHRHPDELKGQAIVCFCVPSAHVPRERRAQRSRGPRVGRSAGLIGSCLSTSSANAKRKVMRRVTATRSWARMLACLRFGNPSALSRIESSGGTSVR